MGILGRLKGTSKCHVCGAEMVEGRRTEVVTLRKSDGKRIKSVYLCSNNCTTDYQAAWIGEHSGDEYEMRSYAYA